MLVKATNQYEKLNVTDKELNRIPKKGEQFEITKERYNVLVNTNEYKVKFVEKVEEIKEVETAMREEKTEKAIIKNTKKDK